MCPFYPPEYEDEAPNDTPYFASPEEMARHQAENLREALGEELWHWLEQRTVNDQR